MDRLTGIELKLKRAEQQISTQRDLPGAWSARENPYGLRPEIDKGKRRYIWALEVRKRFPSELAVVGDEITHHLRSVLDHLAAHLVEASGSQPTAATKWPIEGSRGGWKRNVERRRHWWQFWRKRGGGPLGGIPRDGAVWAFIESTQPYNSGGKARDDLLFALNERWNAYKHRILDPAWLEATPQGDAIDLFDVTPAIEPIDARWIMRTGHKLDDGAKVAIFHFPEDAPLPTMQVKADRQFPVQIAMGDEKGPTHDIEETLERVREIVAEAKSLT